MDYFCCSVWRREINWDMRACICVCVFVVHTCVLWYILQNLSLNEGMLAGWQAHTHTHATAHSRTCPAACHWTGGVEQTALMLSVFFSSPLPSAQHGDPNPKSMHKKNLAGWGKNQMNKDQLWCCSNCCLTGSGRGVVKRRNKMASCYTELFVCILFSCVSLRQLCFHKQYHMCHLFKIVCGFSGAEHMQASHMDTHLAWLRVRARRVWK